MHFNSTFLFPSQPSEFHSRKSNNFFCSLFQLNPHSGIYYFWWFHVSFCCFSSKINNKNRRAILVTIDVTQQGEKTVESRDAFINSLLKLMEAVVEWLNFFYWFYNILFARPRFIQPNMPTCSLLLFVKHSLIFFFSIIKPLMIFMANKYDEGAILQYWFDLFALCLRGFAHIYSTQGQGLFERILPVDDEGWSFEIYQ